MASSEEYLKHVLDLLSKIAGVTHRTVMGGYLPYSGGVLFGGVYNDRFLLKDVPAAREVFPLEQEPYEGARPMLLVDSEDLVQISDTIAAMIPQLVASGTRKHRK